jgi:FtsP/CotA-like multicopper oxidase with cupredoxin domain
MHLHGFYFDVTGEGTGLRHDAYGEADARHVVTHLMPPGSTMELAWTPERAGNWLFHCHIVAHVAPLLRFWQNNEGHAHHKVNHASTGMAGLVMGITVSGDNAPAAPPSLASHTRKLTLTMEKRGGFWKPEDAFGFALKSGGDESAPGDVTVPGPRLVLARNEPVAITLENRLPEATSIHWHGIELESFYDGVAGFSGTSVSTTPLIAPGESTVVRFTPPRAGTFIYHTHSHDNRQLASGLYGALVVVEPGETFDPARDHIVLLGNEGPRDPARAERLPVVVNGTRKAAIALKRGMPNRIRLINITQNFSGLNVSFIHANEPMAWRAAAKDGADLPASQQTTRPAMRQPISVGETYDFVVQPPPAGPMWIEVRRGNGEWVQQVPVTLAP